MLPGLGNSVAEYKVTKKTCSQCGGSGEICHSKKGLIEYMRWMDLGFKEALAYWHEFKHQGYINCPDCGGRGRKEIWA